MQRRILYLPGLDGVANVIDKLQPHLPDAELVPFSYPAGRRLTWVELADLVAAKLKAVETRLLMGESFGGAVALKASIAHRGRAARDDSGGLAADAEGGDVGGDLRGRRLAVHDFRHGGVGFLACERIPVGQFGYAFANHESLSSDGVLE